MLLNKPAVRWSADWFSRGAAFGLLLLFIAATGCRTKPAQPADVAPPAARVAGVLLDQLHQAGLGLQWTTTVPMGPSGEFQQLFYHQQTLYALTDKNVLYAFGGRNGIIKWSVIIAEEGMMCSRPSWYDGHILFVAGNQVIEVSQNDGRISRKMTLNFAPTTNAVRNKDYLFVGSEGRQFYCIRLADEVPVWQAISGEPAIGVIAVDEERCYFTRSDKQLYVSQALRRELVWSAAMKDNSPGVLVDAGQCFLPSQDTALYCFDAATGTPLWKHLAGSAMVNLPAITAQAVYQPVGHRSLVCLSRENGSLRWELLDGLQLLAEKDDLTYALTRSGEITAMDNHNGKRLWVLPMPALSLCAENTQDAMIFLSTHGGQLVALTLEEAPR